MVSHDSDGILSVTRSMFSRGNGFSENTSATDPIFFDADQSHEVSPAHDTDHDHHDGSVCIPTSLQRLQHNDVAGPREAQQATRVRIVGGKHMGETEKRIGVRLDERPENCIYLKPTCACPWTWNPAHQSARRIGKSCGLWHTQAC